VALRTGGRHIGMRLEKAVPADTDHARLEKALQRALA
jgi:hypothetical protein